MNRVKHRSIHNALVNTDDVTVEAGTHFINWIPITRDKLRKRENILLRKRIDKLQTIILKSMDEFINESNKNFKEITAINIERMNKINHENYNKDLSNTSKFMINIEKECNNKIFECLSSWNGVKRSKKNISTFRQYFKIARNTFDQRKTVIYSDNLWSPIIKQITKVFNYI